MSDFPAIDFHCHGIGRFDFATPDQLVLDELEQSLALQGIHAILTLYLPKSALQSFEEFVLAFGRGKAESRYKHILGVALEGPVLASSGGTPSRGCWHPTKAEWRRIARLGQHGLIYVVISPDAEFPVGDGDFPESVLWVVNELMQENVKPALGHFRKDNPERSAAAIEKTCEFAAAMGRGAIFTDHLFNDMPLNFKHSWRTCREKADRPRYLAEILATPWNDANMKDAMGAVPAALIKFAREGVLKICMNFDGEHVDIEICKKAIDLIGADKLMLMTDRIQSNILSGQLLQRIPDNTLLYQSCGVVAGGTQSLARQLDNMIRTGISAHDVVQIAGLNGLRALNLTGPAFPTEHALTGSESEAWINRRLHGYADINLQHVC